VTRESLKGIELQRKVRALTLDRNHDSQCTQFLVRRKGSHPVRIQLGKGSVKLSSKAAAVGTAFDVANLLRATVQAVSPGGACRYRIWGRIWPTWHRR
jgi:hypothetical protein